MTTLLGQVEGGAYPSGIAFSRENHLGAAYRWGGDSEVYLSDAKSFVRKQTIAAPEFEKGVGNASMAFRGDGKEQICNDAVGCTTATVGSVVIYPLDGSRKASGPADEASAKKAKAADLRAQNRRQAERKAAADKKKADRGNVADPDPSSR